MRHQIRRILGSATAIALLLFVAACGGRETVASKSAEAFREAQKKGTPLGGAAHGGHSAASADPGATADQATMTGMDHSTMTGMDHSTMPVGDAMAGMDHSAMKPGQSMAGMDHSKMQTGQRSTAGMDHTSMPGMQSTGAAGSVVMSAPTTSAEMQRMSPAVTLRADDFDAPVAISVSEAMKAAGGGHEMGGMAPVEDRENPPSPAPATRDAGTKAPAPAMDHSQHGQAAPTAAPPPPQSRTAATPKAKPAAATIYACPMHPEVTSDKPGTCPRCGMTLVLKN